MGRLMIFLREQISWLNDVNNSIGFWVIVMAAIFFFFTWGIPFFTRKTKTEIDDIIIGILRIPLIVVFTAYGILDIVRQSHAFDADWVSFARNIIVLITIWALTYLGMRVINDIIVRYAKVYAEESESSLDDVLVPLVENAGTILIMVVALVATIGTFAPALLGQLLTVIGAFSFLLIFLFQEPLSNLFSGVYLWLDSPFKYKDLIFLEDDKSYRVESIGVRVTELYNTNDHTTAFVPNSKLASQRLINVTRPNVELRHRMNIGIAYATTMDNVENVEKLVANLANAHEHTIGPWDKPSPDLKPKRDLILERIAESKNAGDKDEAERIEREYQRLEIEYRLRDTNQEIWNALRVLAGEIGELEHGGLSKEERPYIRAQANEIITRTYEMRRDLTIWVKWAGLLQAWYRLGTPSIRLRDIEESIITVEEWNKIEQATTKEEIRLFLLREEKKAPLIGSFNRDRELLPDDPVLLALPPTSIAVEDFTGIYKRWAIPTRDLLSRLARIAAVEKVRGEREFQLDDFTMATAEKFGNKFMLGTPGFQFPDVDFTGFGESSLDFRLEFFVDDLVGDHFERLDNVFGEIGKMVKAQFDLKSIEVPFPQRDVWFRNALLQRNEKNGSNA